MAWPDVASAERRVKPISSRLFFLQPTSLSTASVTFPDSYACPIRTPRLRAILLEGHHSSDTYLTCMMCTESVKFTLPPTVSFFYMNLKAKTIKLNIETLLYKVSEHIFYIPDMLLLIKSNFSYLVLWILNFYFNLWKSFELYYSLFKNLRFWWLLVKMEA